MKPSTLDCSYTAVQLGGNGPGLHLVQGEAPRHVAHQRGLRRCRGSLAAHVAEEHPVVPAVHAEHVVEVAADGAGRPGRAVQRRDLEPRHRRSRPGQQRLLQRRRHAVLLGEEACVLDRNGLRREDLGEVEVASVEALRLVQDH